VSSDKFLAPGLTDLRDFRTEDLENSTKSVTRLYFDSINTLQGRIRSKNSVCEELTNRKLDNNY